MGYCHGTLFDWNGKYMGPILFQNKQKQLSDASPCGWGEWDPSAWSVAPGASGLDSVSFTLSPLPSCKY